MSRAHLVIIGAGRMGQGLALALGQAGAQVVLVARTPRSVPPPLVVHRGHRGEATRTAETIIIATPDAAIRGLAEELFREGAVTRDQIVLHVSGLLDRGALAALEPTGAGLGSFHPLQTIADPAAAAARVRGAYCGIEGDERAMIAGERLASLLEMHPVRLPAGSKASYHAGAVFAANFPVVLLSVAEQLARDAGVPAHLASEIYLPLLRGAAANLDLGPAAALTGPIRRGDVETVQAHLAALGPDIRQLYRSLGLVALALARTAGLAETAADAIERVLRRDG